MSVASLVSILIPAYRERFFGEALASARAQTYPAVEIVVIDDSPGEAIEGAVRRAADARVRYVRNPRRLGFHGNFTACFEQARGEYVKFLNDDDRLHPQCVAVLAEILRHNSAVTLATSRRFVIDASGARLPDLASTVPLSHVSAFIPGGEMGNFVLMNMLNLIGEPTTAMFRRADVTPEPGGLFQWGGEEYHCLADLSLWLRLLKRGAAFYCAEGLSDFRQHSDQEQGGAARLDCLLERGRIARRAHADGFLAMPGQYVAALRAAHAFAQGVDFQLIEPAVGSRIREEMRGLEAEIARAGGEPVSAPL